MQQKWKWTVGTERCTTKTVMAKQMKMKMKMKMMTFCPVVALH